jgi:hypothetical protein
MRKIAAGLVVLAVGMPVAQAANPETVPAECRAQVAHALSALEPARVGPNRSIAKGGIGTIERAIQAYAPPRLWPVVEGTLPPPRAGACPPDMASVGGRFCVDKYEGSLVVRNAQGTLEPWPAHETPSQDPRQGGGPGSDRVYVAQSVAGVLPQAYISGAQAEAACKNAGKRLCHPVEWRAACGGSQGTVYPYGPKKIAGKCKDTGTAPMMQLHADTMKKGWGMTELNDPRNNQLEGTVAKTGSHPGCVSDQGVYDMVGNLHEWTADPNGTFQGGFWLDTAEHGEGCAYRTIAHGFGYHDYSTGFRCCRDPG